MSALYLYPYRAGNPGIIALNIEDAGLPLPEYLSGDQSYIWVAFAAELDPSQKAILDTLMSSPNVGQIPSTTNSVYEFYDPLLRQAEFNAALAAYGISCNVFPSGPGSCRVIFNKQLTAQDKNRVQTAAWNSLMVLVQ